MYVDDGAPAIEGGVAPAAAARGPPRRRQSAERASSAGISGKASGGYPAMRSMTFTKPSAS
jgi:hypothetical protein